jgi:hypothetical protein
MLHRALLGTVPCEGITSHPSLFMRSCMLTCMLCVCADTEAGREEAEVHVLWHRDGKAWHAPAGDAGRSECHAVIGKQRQAAD